MRKPLEKIGVGQLTLTFEPSKDGAEETQDNGPQASETGPAAERRPGRKKWNSLIDKVYALPNLRSAWERVKANRGAAGVDGMTISRYAERADARLQLLHTDLRNRTYRPRPVRRVLIPKSGGGRRALGVPTVEDRIVQQALLQVLQPIFETRFSSRSHGFRPERGCHTALSVVDRAVRHGYEWVVDADIRSFFDTVDHERLLAAVNEEVADGSVLRLIRRILQAGVFHPLTSAVEPTELGTPQGGPLSPLLANIYLHAFDVQMSTAGYGLVRYADDFVIFARSHSEAEAALEQARAFLEGHLGLHLHPEKTRVVSVTTGFEFLGFHYSRDVQTGEMRKEVRRKSVACFREAIRARTPRAHAQRAMKQRHVTRERLARNQRLREMIRSTNRFLRGWHWYFKDVRSRYTDPFNTFDGFVRERLRHAIVGRVGSGWWRQRITNEMFVHLGLVSMTALQREYLRGHLAAPVREDRHGGEPYAGKPHVRFGRVGGRVTSP